MKEHAELKCVELDEIVLFHENDMHFNLIVSEKDDLVTMGSLSFRANVGPNMKNNDKDEFITEGQVSNNEPIEKENKTLKDQLKQLKEKIIFLEKDYQECEIELKEKTEEVENLKIKMNAQKDIEILKEKANESKEIKSDSCDKRSSDDHTRKSTKEHTRKAHREEEGLKCTVCGSKVSKSVSGTHNKKSRIRYDRLDKMH